MIAVSYTHLGDQAESGRGGGGRRDAGRDESESADHMPRDVCARHVRRDDEDSADDRHGGCLLYTSCEFVDPSKIEIQQIIRDGINLMSKEA